MRARSTPEISVSGPATLLSSLMRL
ncbi:hypothetical protein MAR_029455 [Mya arenaria]|uniref:Uncharacterized protein n=1 Tax=Mya arenaria TaxID=6604 RepID=A0ABY7DJA3_MYAAR|nr:hypothetical protein MAR_029455 [Mya arenaria]